MPDNSHWGLCSVHFLFYVFSLISYMCVTVATVSSSLLQSENAGQVVPSRRDLTETSVLWQGAFCISIPVLAMSLPF